MQRISASGQLRVAAARQIHAERYAIMRADADCLPLEVQIVALVGLFSALEYLAAVPMIHRDVKPVGAFVFGTVSVRLASDLTPTSHRAVVSGIRRTSWQWWKGLGRDSRSC